MVWNYRVMKHKAKPPESLEDWYGIHEVYYDKVGNKIKLGWTEKPLELSFETVKDLQETIKMVQLAFTKPVLNYDGKNK